jgi:hypothetical protein
MWVVMFHFAGAVVAQEMIELGFGFRGILIAATINDIEMLAGVSVIKTNTMLTGV